MERTDPAGGFNVLDGAALVMGSALSSILMLGVRRPELSGMGWIMIGVTFALVAVTAAGPFVYLARRYVRRVPGYPKIGDRLWCCLACPGWRPPSCNQRRRAPSRGTVPCLRPRFPWAWRSQTWSRSPWCGERG